MATPSILADWGSLSAMAREKPKKDFQSEGLGVGRVVQYLCPPLPLTAPLSIVPPPARQDQTQPHHSRTTSLMRLVTAAPECPVLLCYSYGDSQNSTLCLCTLTEVRESCLNEGNFQMFEAWSQANSFLKCTRLKCCKFPHQIGQIDSEHVRGVPFLCVVCSYQLLVYEIPPSSAALSCNWTTHSVVHKSACKIMHAKLSPHVAGEVVVLTEGGGLCVYGESRATVIIKVDGSEVVLGPHLCLFGAHPCQVVWVEAGKLLSVDFRSLELPVNSGQPVGECMERIECVQLWDSNGQPFHLFVATRTQLMLIHSRQPTEPILTVLHHLGQPPLSITVFHTNKKSWCLVLLRSYESSVVIRCQPISSFSVLSALTPHTVCCLSDTLDLLRRSDLCALACSKVKDRFSSYISGAVVVSLHALPNAYGTLVLTELGDVFYQCWQYSEMCGTVSGLNKVYYHGLKLWVHEACSLNPRLSSDTSAADLSSIAKHLLQCQHSKCHCQQLETCNSQPASSYTDELQELRSLYQQLAPSNQFDVALLLEWGATSIQEELAQDGKEM